MTKRTLADYVNVVPHFQRAARIDKDFHEEALGCMVGTETAIRTFKNMAKIYPSGCAFIWTGSYGIGKSSMALQLAALLSNDKSMRDQAMKIFDGRRTRKITDVFLGKGKKASGWTMLPVQGDTVPPGEVLRRVFREKFPILGRRLRKDDNALIKALEAAVGEGSHKILIVFDEMGKFLEHGSTNASDMFFFQKLAEACARSKGRLIMLGLLHMSFQMYADALGRNARQEWSKIQGRFVDMPLVVTPEEQAGIVAEAISHSGINPPLKVMRPLAKAVSLKLVGDERLEEIFIRCWPLHPVTVCLLTRLSQASYAQNQRSIFNFLNSAEPLAFQDFLRGHHSGEELLTPDLLWDYLKVNLEGAISMSVDGHKWSLVENCVNRSAALDKRGMAEKVMKTIGVMYLLGGIKSSEEVLKVCFPRKTMLSRTLRGLQKQSIVVERKHQGAFYPFEGTDFDIEFARKEALGRGSGLSSGRISEIAGIGSILAKGHGIQTGASRYMEIIFISPNDSLGELKSKVFDVLNDKYSPASLCAVMLIDLRDKRATTIDISELSVPGKAKVFIFRPDEVDRLKRLNELIADLDAYETVRKSQELQSDRIAKNEVVKRLGFTAERLRYELSELFKGYPLSDGTYATNLLELGKLASEKADEMFPKTPRLHNELINRAKITGTATAAMRKLMTAMVKNADQKKLGLSGYPAEMGLYLSVVQQSGLHRAVDGMWGFWPPEKHGDARILELWKEAISLLKKADGKVAVREIFDYWSAPPYGLKKGPSILILWAILLANRGELSVYQSGVYRPELDETDIDAVLLEGDELELMWIELDAKVKRFLSNLAKHVDWAGDPPKNPTPLNISRSLVKRILSLPEWVQKTDTLSKETKKLRDMLKRASDPNKVIFSELPAIFKAGGNSSSQVSAIAKVVANSVKELHQAYPKMVEGLEKTMVDSIGLTGEKVSLAKRASMILGKTGNLRLDAFAQRLEKYRPGDIGAMETIGSLAANKPVEMWSDSDYESANNELAMLAKSFIRTEVLVKSRSRNDANIALGLVTASNGTTKVKYSEVFVQKKQMPKINKEASRIISVLRERKRSQEELLAIVAVMGSKLTEGNHE